jgi:hypothetical protein
VLEVSSGLTPMQRSRLVQLLSTELVRARTAALAAGADEIDVDAASVCRRRAIEAMIVADPNRPEPDL